MLSSRRKLCRRYNGMRCEADRRAHIPRVGTLTPSRTHYEADRRAHIPRVSTLTPFRTHCEADRRAHIPRLSTLTPFGTHCEADRRAHIPRVGTLGLRRGKWRRGRDCARLCSAFPYRSPRGHLQRTGSLMA